MFDDPCAPCYSPVGSNIHSYKSYAL